MTVDSSRSDFKTLQTLRMESAEVVFGQGDEDAWQTQRGKHGRRDGSLLNNLYFMYVSFKLFFFAV